MQNTSYTSYYTLIHFTFEIPYRILLHHSTCNLHDTECLNYHSFFVVFIFVTDTEQFRTIIYCLIKIDRDRYLKPYLALNNLSAQTSSVVYTDERHSFKLL